MVRKIIQTRAKKRNLQFLYARREYDASVKHRSRAGLGMGNTIKVEFSLFRRHGVVASSYTNMAMVELCQQQMLPVRLCLVYLRCT